MIPKKTGAAAGPSPGGCPSHGNPNNSIGSILSTPGHDRQCVRETDKDPAELFEEAIASFEEAVEVMNESFCKNCEFYKPDVNPDEHDPYDVFYSPEWCKNCKNFHWERNPYYLSPDKLRTTDEDPYAIGQMPYFNPYASSSYANRPPSLLIKPPPGAPGFLFANAIKCPVIVHHTPTDMVIKDDYVKRPDVLQYVLHKVLHMPNYYKFDEPAACRRLLENYAIFNDNIREFWEEFRDQFMWNFLPFDFLYDLYLSWMKKVNPSGKPLSKSNFKQEMRQIVQTGPDWMVYVTKKGDEGRCRPGPYITQPEPLIDEYGLHNWHNLTYLIYPTPNAPNAVPHMNLSGLKASYPGLIRKTPRTPQAVPQTAAVPCVGVNPYAAQTAPND